MAQRKSSYWRQQIILNAVLGVLFAVGGMIYMVFSPVDKGLGLIFFLAGLGFFGALIFVSRQYRRMSNEQRAVYAWAIAQQMSGAGHRTPGGDIEMMAVATAAQKGTLPPVELQRLQNLNPRNPYPVRPPAPPTPTWSDPGL
ncbi:hypothetical protein [Okibacterium fritillariae]|uniref:Uncharacterized protein n=1 Tax=Okibacterium fritillariae TaxID=123320 RepID=A0A1T5IDI4_9MICO|nr:hypothetical protein [Okibacterium fritillariae]SKC37083.1 hypothetical protein SAMN06309945_0276 [Okibacterium fritillariae]